MQLGTINKLIIIVLFQAHMKFPPDYPYSPPSIRFLTKVWHPNVYEVSAKINFVVTRLVIYCIIPNSVYYIHWRY